MAKWMKFSWKRRELPWLKTLLTRLQIPRLTSWCFYVIATGPLYDFRMVLGGFPNSNRYRTRLKQTCPLSTNVIFENKYKCYRGDYKQSVTFYQLENPNLHRTQLKIRTPPISFRNNSSCIQSSWNHRILPNTCLECLWFFNAPNFIQDIHA